MCYAKHVRGAATVGRNVAIIMDFDQLGLLSNVDVAVSLTIEEARYLSALLSRKADEAEGLSPLA
jgi:hypothetical protein